MGVPDADITFTTDTAVLAVEVKLTRLRFCTPPLALLDCPNCPVLRRPTPQPSHSQPGDVESELVRTDRSPTVVVPSPVEGVPPPTFKAPY